MPNSIRELPLYQCHKQVRALKIANIDGDVITPEDASYAPFTVSADYTNKHKPKAGGYYVVYASGYESFSPADAFEDGYTRLD